MTVQEKIERLKRERTPYSTEELDRLGWARYAEIRDQLEASHHGEYVMIEVDSGDYFVGKTPEDALRRARAAHPNKAFYLIRIGYKAAHKLKTERA
jgi:2',3'-cyclic-nucleotide 2'-phosphodiesterase (5'-nucleotidase family)